MGGGWGWLRWWSRVVWGEGGSGSDVSFASTGGSRVSLTLLIVRQRAALGREGASLHASVSSFRHHAWLDVSECRCLPK